MASEPEGRKRNALVSFLLTGVLLLAIGLLVGFTERSTVILGGADCGSVLGGGSEQLTSVGIAACGRALSTPATWTWILLAGFAFCVISGIVVDALQAATFQAARGARSTPES